MKKQYRKKPIIIEAEQFNWPNPKLFHQLDYIPNGVKNTSYMEVAKLIGTSGCSREKPYWDWSVMGVINTPEGPQLVIPGDYIITGIEGEIYSCKKEIFEKSYDIVEKE